MSRYDISKNARCPYYRSEDKKQSYRIRCSGIADGSWIHLVFADRSLMLNWRDKHCKCGWEHCPIAKMIDGEQHEEG